MNPPPPRPVRPLCLDDVPDLARLLSASLGPNWRDESVREELRRRGAWGWGRVERGRLLSAAIGWRLLDEAEVTAVVTEAGYRGRGLAHHVLGAALDALEAAGVRRCFLEVEEGNEAARRLYRRLGFRETGRRKGYYGPGLDAITMCREGGKSDPSDGGK